MIGGGSVVSQHSSSQSANGGSERNSAEDAMNQIRESLRGLRFGSVNIIVQDGVVIQIDRTEKRRLRVGRGNGNTT
jgi:hypothetical protein